MLWYNSPMVIEAGPRSAISGLGDPKETGIGNLNPSPRRKETLLLIAQGYTIKEIAKKMSVCSSTIRNNCDELFIKFGVNNQFQLVIVAVNNGILSLSDLPEYPGKNKMLTLSKREIEILKLMTDNSGKNSAKKSIADCLFISTETARNHVQNMKRKLSARNRVQLVMFYLKAKRDGDLTEDMPPQSFFVEMAAILKQREGEKCRLSAQGLSDEEIRIPGDTFPLSALIREQTEFSKL